MAQPQPRHPPTNTAATLPARAVFPNTHWRSPVQQHSLITSVGLHLIPGACMVLFYVLVAPLLSQAGLPPVWGLLLGTLLIVVPFELGLVLYAGKQLTGRLSLRGSVVYNEPLRLRQYLWLVPLVVLASFLLPGLVVSLEPLVRRIAYGWLPAWFSAGPGQLAVYSPTIRSATVGLWIVSQVFAGPIVEELYFRGYLLPRIAYLNGSARLLNAVLFGVYHFWQPYAVFTIILFALPLAYAVWWKRNVYLSMIAHCTINFIAFISLFAGIVSR